MPDVPTRDAVAQIADPAERLVQAGARLLADDGFRVLAGGLRPETVTAIAGRTRRMFYDHFETKEDYARAVFDAYLDITADHTTLTETFAGAFEDLIFGARGDIIEAVWAISDALFTTSADSAELVIHTAAWAAAASDDHVRATVGRYFETMDDFYEEMVSRALVEWGQKLRPPWTARDLSLVIGALSDGFNVRNRVRDDQIDASFLATCVLAIIAPVMQPVDEADRPFGEELRGLSRQNATQWRERHDPALIANTRQRVLDSVVPALRSDGLDAVTMESIARWADVGIGSLKHAFANADEVICSAVLDALPAFDREIDFDLGTETMTHRKVLHRHLLRLAQWTADEPELAHAALTLPLLRPGRHPDEPPARLVASLARPATRILEATEAQPGTRSLGESEQLALMLTNAVLGRSVRPHGGDHTLVTWLTDLALGPEER